VLAGELTWQEAVSGEDTAWAIEAEKADRAQLLIAVHDDVITGAWRVTDVSHRCEAPPGKKRKINRSRFATIADDRLDFLVHAPSPILRRRNPQGVMEIRDLLGAEVLLADAQPPAHGIAQLGGYTLIVAEDQTAELRTPPGAIVTIRPEKA
jgi:hypothetical protein